MRFPRPAPWRARGLAVASGVLGVALVGASLIGAAAGDEEPPVTTVAAAGGRPGEPLDGPDPMPRSGPVTERSPEFEDRSPPCDNLDDHDNAVYGTWERIQQIGWSTYRHSYAGAYVCYSTGTVRVLRVPDAAFERAARRIGKRLGVRVQFRDAYFSWDEIRRTKRAVRAHQDELNARGVRIFSIAQRPEGHLVVGVGGPLPRAKKVLADFRDRVVVARGARVKLK